MGAEHLGPDTGVHSLTEYSVKILEYLPTYTIDRQLTFYSIVTVHELFSANGLRR